MSREQLIRQHFTRDMRLLEIGPSYNPVVPKADGWQTTVIDHASKAELMTKYAAVGTADRIEVVDHIWQAGPLADLLPPEQHGSFDGLVASHVGEHFPDLIGFLKNASTLLKPAGLMALALPDKRVCFDFFQPLTTTGDLVAAHLEGRTRHRRRTYFNQSAYYVTRNKTVGWARSGETAPFELVLPLSHAQFSYDDGDESPASEYRDTHAWTFTPKSFELLILELNLLGYIDWSIRAIEPALGIEFYVWLERKKLAMPEAAINPARMALLQAIVRENQESIAQLDSVAAPAPPVPAIAAPPPTPAKPPQPEIVAIIPLYNGAPYIEQTLNSVLRQSLAPTEIIVVNDGSTDGGAGVAIVERMAQSHPIRLLHQENGGQSSARNLGVRESTSPLIALLDQDDVWYENHLAELVKPFTKPHEPPLGWSYSDLDEIDEHGRMICRSFLSTIETTQPKRHIYECIRQDMFILPSASLISREAFEAVQGFDERLCGYEDDDLFMRIFRAGYHNVFIRRALSQWRIYPGSTSYSYRMALSRNIYTRKLIEMFPNDPERVRFYVRDLIVPRFFGAAVKEYEMAYKRGDAAARAAAWDEVMLLVRHNSIVDTQRLVEHAADRFADALQAADQNAVDRAWEELALVGDGKAVPSGLLHVALVAYKAALLAGDKNDIATAWQRVTSVEVASRQPGSRHRRVRATLRLLRNPVISRSAFKLRQVGRPVMIWAFGH